MQGLPTNEEPDLEFFLLHTHTHKTIGDKRATPKLTLIYPLTELQSIVGASTAIVEIGIIPQTISSYDSDTWTITNFIRLDTQGFTQM